jgi:hypothetical protein
LAGEVKLAWDLRRSHSAPPALTDFGSMLADPTNAAMARVLPVIVVCVKHKKGAGAEPAPMALVRSTVKGVDVNGADGRGSTAKGAAKACSAHVAESGGGGPRHSSPPKSRNRDAR